MSRFIGGPLDGKLAGCDAGEELRYVEGPWPGRYELIRTARISDQVVLFDLAYRYDASYVRHLDPEIFWIGPE